MPGDGVRGARAVMGLLAGVPLRVRLVAVACCLVAAGAGIIGLACGLAARGGLMGQADQELRAYAGLLTSRPFTAMPAGPGPGGVAGGGFALEVVTGGQLVLRAGPDPRPGPALAGIPVRAGQLATIPAGSGGGSWLVVAEPVHYSARRIPFTYGPGGLSLSITSAARPGTAGMLVAELDITSVGQAVRKITISCIVVVGAAVLAVAVLGLAVTGAILRPLARTQKPAADVAACGSSQRMRSVLAGTCCELRRPVSIIAGFTEYYRQRGPLAARELDRMMARVADEAARMDALIDDLASTRTRTHDHETDGHAGAGQRASLPPSLQGKHAGPRSERAHTALPPGALHPSRACSLPTMRPALRCDAVQSGTQDALFWRL